jgi:hypothetical protein
MSLVGAIYRLVEDTAWSKYFTEQLTKSLEKGARETDSCSATRDY